MVDDDWMDGSDKSTKVDTPPRPKAPKKPGKMIIGPAIDWEAIKKCVNEYLSRNLYSYTKMKPKPSAEYSEIVRWFERIAELKAMLKKNF